MSASQPDDEPPTGTKEGALFRWTRRAGKAWDTRKKQAGQILLHSPFHPLYLKIRGPQRKRNADADYQRWIGQEESSWPSREEHQARASGWKLQPTVSILLVAFRPNREWLEKAVASVKMQSYVNWELCICDNGSGEPWLRQYLRDQAAAEGRIRLLERESPERESSGGISAALNDAGQMATGEIVAFLDQHDELHPYALHYVVETLQEDGVDVVYSDEDSLAPDGTRVQPAFKPDWSPELLDACMYFGRMFVARRSLIDQIGWFRTSCDGAQDYDLALRLIEHARKIRHVARVLYHGRQHKQSTHEAGKRAAADAVARRLIDATVEDGPLRGTYYIRRADSTAPVSLIVCSRDPGRLSAFLAAQKRTSYRDVELVIVEHVTPQGRDLSQLLDSTPCVRVRYDGPFNFSRMNNLGADAAGSELLVFINDDVMPLQPRWLDAMVAQLGRPEIGVAGARLLYPSGAIQHAGIAIGIQDGAGHPGRGGSDAELMFYLQLPRNVSAVTGACLGIRRDLFRELGGFDVSFPVNYNDVDLCLRTWERGLRVVVDPRVELTHIECGTRQGGTTEFERKRFHERWRTWLTRADPYYPQVFDRNTEEIRLAVRR